MGSKDSRLQAEIAQPFSFNYPGPLESRLQEGIWSECAHSAPCLLADVGESSGG